MDYRVCKTCDQSLLIKDNYFINNRGFANTSCKDCDNKKRRKPKLICVKCNVEKYESQMNISENTCLKCDDIAQLEKECIICNLTKDVGLFVKNRNQCKECRNSIEREVAKQPARKEKEKERAKIKYQKNKEKHCEITSRYYHENLEKRKDLHLRKTYGITMNDKVNIRKIQMNKCKICEKEFDNDKMAYVDHCHDTKRIRGLLCHQCNSGIGYMKDNITNLKNAIVYLSKRRKSI